MSLRSTNNITENTSFLVKSYETKLLFTDWITWNLRVNGLNSIYCGASSNSVDSKCLDFIRPIYTWIILFDCAFVVIVYRNGYVNSANILILWFCSLSVFGHSLVLTPYVKHKRHEKVFWFKCGAYILIIYYVNLG